MSEHYISPRSASRLAAVQAVFQHGQRPQSERALLREFQDAGRLRHADAALFEVIVGGVLAEKQTLEAMITPYLSAQWSWARLDTVVQALLLCGVYELWQQPETPTGVIIDEYLEIVHAFEMEQERPFVHKVLDNSAKELRAA